MKLLAIETSTEICSIAYIEKGECKFIVEDLIPRQHAEQLPIFFNQLVKESKIHISELDGISISIGPGSFTGLRIGLSYAKGLAYSQKLPIIPVPTLQSINYGYGKTDADAIIMRSHGNKYFFQSLNYQNGEIFVEEIQVLALDTIKDIPNLLNIKKILHYGCDKLFENEKSVESITVTPSAKWIGELAYKNYSEWVVNDPLKIIPDYISPFKIN